MTEDTFWDLIDMVPIYDVANDLGGAADDNDLKDLEAKLAQLSDTDMIAFFHLFSTKLHALDTPAHYDACRVGGGEASQDVYLYARCHLLMLGRDRYEDVLNTPANFPPDLWFEDILGLANEAYDRVYDRDPDPGRQPSYKTFSNDAWNIT